MRPSRFARPARGLSLSMLFVLPACSSPSSGGGRRTPLDALPALEALVIPDSGPLESRPPIEAGTATVASVLCKACTTSADCGGNGAICIFDDTSPMSPAFCGLDCSAPAATCPAQTACFTITVVGDGGVRGIGANCYPVHSCVGFVAAGECATSSQCPAGSVCQSQYCVVQPPSDHAAEGGRSDHAACDACRGDGPTRDAGHDGI